MTNPTHIPRPQHRFFAFVYGSFMEKADKKKMGPLRTFAAGGATGRVLEFGAGTGSNLEYYDWSKVESLELTEPDPFMLKRIPAKLAALPDDARAKVHLSDAPAEALPFPDASFDTAVVTLVLCSVSYPDRAIAELRRVLKPGGQARLVEHHQADGFKRKLQRFVQPVYGKMSGDCQLSRRTEEALRDAGFEVEITKRDALGPLWPVIVGIATKK
ncbi:MAG TPA: class I SAM-dependent methyltransferase [Dehalococcoidia bacterium]|nr:class I SAM-dependent methyltransferase [Dehalococcoidia bacterium]